MSNNACSEYCGYCGRCEDKWVPFECAYCNMPCENDTYYPYCGPICALDAEQYSEEDAL